MQYLSAAKIFRHLNRANLKILNRIFNRVNVEIREVNCNYCRLKKLNL
jgi:hypothetical protein